jgi:hypothetical protein
LKLGLGFTFGAKDQGLKKQQQAIATGFGKIFAEVAKLSDAVKTINIGAAFESFPTGEIDKQAESVRGLAKSFGKMPQAGREAGEALQTAGKQAEVGSRKFDRASQFMKDTGDALNLVFTKKGPSQCLDESVPTVQP